ncbi:MAG: hypothetical protein PF450_11810 [Bacteroidales bacterium]|nr:hypothetical protein [Bacteroidales bacterium]
MDNIKDELEMIHSRFNFILAIGDLISCLSDSSLRDETLAATGGLLIWISEDALDHLRNIHTHILSSGGNK